MKRRKGNDYLQQLKQAQGTNAKAKPEAKPASEMSEAELSAEVARLEREVRKSFERSVDAGREELAGAKGSGPGHWFVPKRRRPPWR